MNTPATLKNFFVANEPFVVPWETKDIIKIIFLFFLLCAFTVFIFHENMKYCYFACDCLTVVVPVFYLKYCLNEPLWYLGIKRERWSHVLLIGIGLGTAIFILEATISLSIIRLVPSLVKSQPLELLLIPFVAVKKAGLFGALIRPFGEELFFRGLLYSRFRRNLSVVKSTILCSFFFSLAHYYGGQEYNLRNHFLLFFVGFLLCIIYERSRSLAVVTVSHSSYNIFTTCSNALIYLASKS